MSEPDKPDYYRLMLAVAENAEHITPRMQDLIADYLGHMSQPKMNIDVDITGFEEKMGLL